MLKKVNRKTKKTAPLVHVKPGCNRARPQSLSDEASVSHDNAIISLTWLVSSTWCSSDVLGG